MQNDMNRTYILPLVVFVFLSGCDLTGGTNESRVASRVFVKAESVDLLGPAIDARGDSAVAFRYVGSVPAPCYELSGYSTGAEGPNPSRYMVRVRADATSKTCSSEQGTIRVDSLTVPMLPEGTYTFAFDRRTEPPIEIQVEFPL